MYVYTDTHIHLVTARISGQVTAAVSRLAFTAPKSNGWLPRVVLWPLCWKMARWPHGAMHGREVTVPWWFWMVMYQGMRVWHKQVKSLPDLVCWVKNVVESTVASFQKTKQVLLKESTSRLIFAICMETFQPNWGRCLLSPAGSPFFGSSSNIHHDSGCISYSDMGWFSAKRGSFWLPFVKVDLCIRQEVVAIMHR